MIMLIKLSIVYKGVHLISLILDLDLSCYAEVQ